ncbi:MAG: hypothetical protein ACRYFS_13025 [Janthinobacterium lividum]
MEQLVKKVNTLLEASFPGIEVAIAVKRGIKRATGFVIWSGFAGKPHLERQSQLWKVLKANLSHDEELKLGTILTITPQEVAAMDEVAVAA